MLENVFFYILNNLRGLKDVYAIAVAFKCK